MVTLKEMELFKEYNVGVVVSLNGFSDFSHDQFTGIKKSFTKVFNTINSLIHYRINLAIKANFNKINYSHDEFSRMLDFCINNNIDLTAGFVFFPALNHDVSPCKLQLDNNTIYQALLIYYDYFSKKSVRKRISKECIAGKYQINISSCGDVYPCPTFPLKVGNINGNIVDIWKGSNILNELRSIQDNQFTKCGTCDDKDYCVSFCLAMNYLWNKDFFKIPQNICDIAKIQHEVSAKIGDRDSDAKNNEIQNQKGGECI